MYSDMISIYYLTSKSKTKNYLTVDTGIAIREILYTVRSVSYVLHKITKSSIPTFFVD